MNFNFNTSFSMEFDAIDNKHKELFNRVNKLLYALEKEKDSNEILKALDSVEHYANNNFDEEMTQTKYNFSELKMCHRKLNMEIRKLRYSFENPGVSSLFTPLMQKEIMKWSKNYIIGLHKYTYAFLNENSSSSAEVML